MNTTISFEQDAHLAQQLLMLLHKEQSSLVAIDVDAMERLLEEKSVLLNQMSEVAQKRYQRLAGFGFEASELGMTAWVKQQKNQIIQAAWNNFQKMLIQAKEMNRLNGVLIGKHFQRNQEMLTQLQLAANGTTSVYGKNGQTSGVGRQRSALIV